MGSDHTGALGINLCAGRVHRSDESPLECGTIISLEPEDNGPSIPETPIVLVDVLPGRMYILRIQEYRSHVGQAFLKSEKQERKASGRKQVGMLRTRKLNGTRRFHNFPRSHFSSLPHVAHRHSRACGNPEIGCCLPTSAHSSTVFRFPAPASASP